VISVLGAVFPDSIAGVSFFPFISVLSLWETLGLGLVAGFRGQGSLAEDFFFEREDAGFSAGFGGSGSGTTFVPKI
jgi:hypothetical protein